MSAVHTGAHIMLKTYFKKTNLVVFKKSWYLKFGAFTIHPDGNKIVLIKNSLLHVMKQKQMVIKYIKLGMHSI